MMVYEYLINIVYTILHERLSILRIIYNKEDML